MPMNFYSNEDIELTEEFQEIKFDDGALYITITSLEESGGASILISFGKGDFLENVPDATTPIHEIVTPGSFISFDKEYLNDLPARGYPTSIWLRSDPAGAAYAISANCGS